MEENIKNIVELDIDFDNFEMANMGVDVISLVTEPAIEVDFMAFASEEFVEPHSGESEEEFIGRCIPVLIGEGKDQDVAAAICYSYWEGKQEFSEEYTEEQKIILEWAEEYGELITEHHTYIKEGEEFASVSDIASAIQGLDILSRLGIRSGEPAETKYRYTGPSAERGFCKAMMRLNKMYSDADMDVLRSRLSVVNPGMGPRGRNSYSVFEYKGGVNCRHWWSKLAVFRPEGGRVLTIEQGTADGNAGKSNNSKDPSPSGSVANNARYGFTVADDEKRIVAGVFMIPNQMILRREANGDPFYVYFSKDTIRRIQERFNAELKNNNTDTQHDGNVHTKNVLLEQWIIESNVHDKSKFYGFDNLPLGSWFGVYKVNSDEDWARIKSGELRGFSVAGNFIERAKPVGADEETLSKIIDILNKIR